MEDRIPLSEMPINYISPIEREATDILSVYYEGGKARRDWEIAITELEKLDERCMDITTETRLVDLYRREYGDWEHGNINGMAYWRRKMLYTAAKMKLYNDDALMWMFDNLNWMWHKLDFAAAKYIGKVGYGYEIDNPIVTTEWEYTLLLNSLKPEKGELIYYFRASAGGVCKSKNHPVDTYYVYVADDTIEHNLFLYIMYVDMYNGVSSNQCPEGFSFDPTRERITCGCTDTEATINKCPEKFRYLYVD